MGSTGSPPRNCISGFRSLPNAYAQFTQRLVFTTLEPKDVALGPYAHPVTGKPMHLFTLDDDMVYTPFKNDHGPLNLAYTFDACVRIYDKLNAKEHKRRALCLYTSPDPEKKSNMALVAALYALIVEHHDPWDAFQPLAHFELLPFRDAGNGVNEFGVTIQDVLYGVWKAGKNGLLQLQEFDADDYRYFERVENGDLNVLGSFIAFASPMDPSWIIRSTPPGERPPMYSSSQGRMLTAAFEKVMTKFYEEDVKLVIRLNDELYDRSHFVQTGMDHVDLYFDDGTNPTDEIVRDFIRIVDDTIARGKKVAVHCKAGLGRTGVLIGAYLIYKHQFTASEVIGYMRVIRPGMVVGPQQRYMQLNQMKWAGWAAIDAHRPPNFSDSLPSPPMENEVELVPVSSLPQVETPSRPLTPAKRVPAPTPSGKGGDAPCQPRKGRTLVEVTPEPEENLPPMRSRSSTPKRTTTQSIPPSPSSDRGEGSVRGIKRGSGRTPVSSPQPVRGQAPPPASTPRLAETQAGRLVRSTSSASCSSSVSELDQRATKRRNGDSPLAKSGLSSPPPSRDTTPADDLPPAPTTFPIEESEEPTTPPASKLTFDSNTQVMTPPSPAQRELPRSRSLIPRRGGIPIFKDEKPARRSGRTKSATDTGSLSDSEVSSAVSSSGVASTPSSNTRSNKVPSSTRRALLSTPRVWNTLSRLGGAALGQ